jgi:hypothetical protein
MNELQFREYVIKAVKENPTLKSDIMDVYYMCMEEVESGGSFHHEARMAMDEIEHMIKEK